MDEAGSSADMERQPIITVAAIIVHGDLQTLPIEKDAGEIVTELVPERLRRQFEFHGKDLFPIHGRYRNWNLAQRHEVFKRFLGLIPKHNLPVIHASLHQENFLRLYEQSKPVVVAPPAEEQAIGPREHLPHGAAFLICASDIEVWFRTTAQFERGICIADDTKTKPFLKRNLKGLRIGIASAPGPLVLQMDHLIDTMYFGDSRESIFLQLADACAFVIKRMALKRDDTRDFYEIIHPQTWPQQIRVHFGDASLGVS